MLSFPSEFSEKSQARVHAERIRVGRDFEQAAEGARNSSEIVALLRTCILRVFLVFAEEAAELGRRGTWSVGDVASAAQEFLRLWTIEVYFERSYDSRIRSKDVISSWNGSILPPAQREFERSPEWKRYEDLLLELAGTQSSSGIGDSSPSGGDPKTLAESQAPRGYRTEIREWMAREGLTTLEAAAKRLTISLSALKSIMSHKGKRRYGEATLTRILGIIGYKGE